MQVVCVAGPGGGVPERDALALAAAVTESVPGATVELVARNWRPAPDAEIDCLVTLHVHRSLAVLPAGVRWVQLWGTGVDRLVPEVFSHGRTVTCARGASGVPIAEFVMASMLAVEKHFPAPR